MKQHILLEKSYCYPESSGFSMPTNFTFSEQHGYWKDNATGEIMMLSDNKRRPQTKKEDIETGEDQKGE